MVVDVRNLSLVHPHVLLLFQLVDLGYMIDQIDRFEPTDLTCGDVWDIFIQLVVMCFLCSQEALTFYVFAAGCRTILYILNIALENLVAIIILLTRPRGLMGRQGVMES